MESNPKRKRWTVENFLNLAPNPISKFKCEDGFEKCLVQDPKSQRNLYELKRIFFTPIFHKQKDFDMNLSLLENLLRNEKNSQSKKYGSHLIFFFSLSK